MTIYFNQACTAFVDASHALRSKMLDALGDTSAFCPIPVALEAILNVGSLYVLVNRGFFSSPLKNALLLSAVLLLKAALSPKTKIISFYSGHGLVSIPLVLLASRSKVAALPLIVWTVARVLWPASSLRG